VPATSTLRRLVTYTVIDLRALNRVSVPDNYPPPSQSSITEALRGKSFITTIGATSFFYQFGIYPPNQDRFTLISPRGLEWVPREPRCPPKEDGRTREDHQDHFQVITTQNQTEHTSAICWVAGGRKQTEPCRVRIWVLKKSFDNPVPKGRGHITSLSFIDYEEDLGHEYVGEFDIGRGADLL